MDVGDRIDAKVLTSLMTIPGSVTVISTYLASSGSKDTCTFFAPATTPAGSSDFESKTCLNWLSVSATAIVNSPVDLSKYSLSNSTMWIDAVWPVSILIQLSALLLTHEA